MNTDQFRRYLVSKGCTIEHGTRHDLVHRDGRTAALPRHGGRKQLGLGLTIAIEKRLGLR